MTFAIEFENAHVDFIANVDDFRRMLDALPRHVRDVQQAVDTAEVDERTVIGEVLDRAFDDCAFLQLLEELSAFCAVFLLHDCATGNHNVVALLVELDDFELEHFAFEIRRIAHWAHIDERTWKERADEVDLDGEAAFDAAIDDALDDFLLLERCLESRPRTGALGFFA